MIYTKYILTGNEDFDNEFDEEDPEDMYWDPSITNAQLYKPPVPPRRDATPGERTPHVSTPPVATDIARNSGAKVPVHQQSLPEIVVKSKLKVMFSGSLSFICFG